jgi:Dyp-type peroxidase family
METEVLGQTVGRVSELTHLVPIREGYLSRDQYPGAITRPITYRLRLELLLSGLRKLEERTFPTPVRRLSVIHSARWAIVDAGTGMLTRPHLLFATQYDGSWHDYIKQFSEEVWPMMDLIWSNCDGYQGAYDFRALAEFVTKYQITADALYVDAPELSVGEVRQLQDRRRRELSQYVADAEPSQQERDLAAKLFDKLKPLYPAELFDEARRRLLPWPIAPLPEPPARDIVLADVQPHVVEPLDADCAVTFFVRFGSGEHARRAIERVYAAQAAEPPSGVRFNVGFSYAGLDLLGLPGSELAKLGPAFRAGMRARASWLGDRESDHPAKQGDIHAALTAYGKATRAGGVLPAQRAEQLRLAIRDDLNAHGQNVGSDLLALLGEAHEQLAGAFVALMEPVALELVEQHRGHRLVVAHPDGSDRVYEYFGFEDGQPLARQEPAQRAADMRRALIAGPDPLLENGTFLVVRKLEQDVEGFHRWAHDEPALASLMMGRAKQGKPLGDVDFVGDAQGKTCPFQSHVRRANPRTPESRTREMVRRSMSYLERGGQRGLLFVAFNRSLEDQFEFVQRNWIARGDTVGGFREDVDPIIGRATSAARFAHHRGEERSSVPLSVNSFVALRGGAYFFVPSRPALLRLARPADAVPVTRVHALQDEPSAACHAFWRARACDLEDTARSPAFWRSFSPGVRVDDHAVFVGGTELAKQVLGDDRVFSVREFGRRMQGCTGKFFLGMDPVDERGEDHGAEACTYRRQRAIADRIIPMANAHGRGTDPEAFAVHVKKIADLARAVLKTQAKLERAREVQGRAAAFFELDAKHYIAGLLGQLTGEYFGIYDPIDYRLATWSHHVALHVFGECPDARVKARALSDGADFRSYVAELVRLVRTTSAEEAPLLKLREVVEQFRALRDERGEPAFANENELVDTLLGLVSGALATTAGLFAQALAAYAREQTQPTFTLPLAADRPGAQLLDALRRKGVSVPERIYRVCREDTVLGGQRIEAGSLVVVGQGSALAESPGEAGELSFFGYGRHRCPAEALALAIIDGAALALSERGELTVLDEAAELFRLAL